MPFVRRSRDRRGYESTCVMHVYRPANGPPQTRLLYLFRTPAHLKVGRPAIDDEAMEGLEHTHPDLSFDWSGLLSQAADLPEQRWERPMRPPPRPGDRERGARERRGTPPSRGPAGDGTLLGRIVGAADAARLRKEVADLRDRIQRRARTPEERERLSAELERLNPDAWKDEAAARAAARTLSKDLARVAAELPGRRRGRRGGQRFEPAEGRDAPAQEAADASGIMSDGRPDDQVLDASHPDRGAGDAGDHGRAGAEPDAEAGPAGSDSDPDTNV